MARDSLAELGRPALAPAAAFLELVRKASRHNAHFYPVFFAGRSAQSLLLRSGSLWMHAHRAF
jgi:hypothetical protein